MDFDYHFDKDKSLQGLQQKRKTDFIISYTSIAWIAFVYDRSDLQCDVGSSEKPFILYSQLELAGCKRRLLFKKSDQGIWSQE